jgi:hypothetical protein
VSDYVRPAIPEQTYHDVEGNVIDYGNRWRDRPGRMPPDDLYEVTSNLERFAGFHVLADALIQHLRENYAVSVIEDVTVAEDLLDNRVDVARAVRVVPDRPDAAPLTFVYTALPGLILHAGLLHDFPFPTCGCDACDETVDALAGDLENTVLAVAAGRFSESVSPVMSGPFELEIAHELGDRGTTFWGRGGSTVNSQSERAKNARQRLAHLPNGWQPWQRRP